MSSFQEDLYRFVIAIRGLLSNEKGATATEYSLLVGLIALVIVAGVTLFGGNLNTFFSDLAGSVSAW